MKNQQVITMKDNQAVLRFRKFYRKGDTPGKYKHSYKVIDDHTEKVLATCDLFGQAIFSNLAITDDKDQTWQMKPNRKIMPSRWIITDCKQNIAMQLDQKILGKIVNPIYKVMLGLLDGEGREVYRFVDPRTNIPDRIMAIFPNEWALLKEDTPMAKIISLPRKTKESKGLLGKLRSFIPATDDGLISIGSEPLLEAPVALGMYIIFSELKSKMAAT